MSRRTPMPMPAKIRPTIIWGTDQADACKAPPMMTNRFPRRMQLRLPRGIPIIITASEQTVAASVYADAIMGMTQGPVGYCTKGESVYCSPSYFFRQLSCRRYSLPSRIETGEFLGLHRARQHRNHTDRMTGSCQSAGQDIVKRPESLKHSQWHSW